jgi:hypothetical protein
MKQYISPITVPQIKLDTPQQLSVFQNIAYPVKINYPRIFFPTKCTILVNQFTNIFEILVASGYDSEMYRNFIYHIRFL